MNKDKLVGLKYRTKENVNIMVRLQIAKKNVL